MVVLWEAEILDTKHGMANFIGAEETMRQSQHVEALGPRLDKAIHEWAELSESINAKEMD